MKCPFCTRPDSKVLDSRETEEGSCIRRRRVCQTCDRRFTTYERIDETPLMVVKKDKRREPFDLQKVMTGIFKACEKRPVSLHTAEEIARTVERELRQRPDAEVPARLIGEQVMEQLLKVDPVAYIRYASVYKEFKDVRRFVEELKRLEAELAVDADPLPTKKQDALPDGAEQAEIPFGEEAVES